VGVHPVYLASEFRKHFGCTIGEYVRKLRVEFACRRISESDSPLSDIAIAAGFSHQSHFSRTFKAVTGMTPAGYRTAVH
jgi:AraC family transcriptional regulator